MWACAAIFYAYQFALRVSPSAMADDLMRDLSVEGCALGTLSSFYYLGYAGAQIPVGIILDMIGPRRPLTVGCILCILGCALFIATDHVMIMSMGRFFIGVGSAFGFLSCLKIANIWFIPKRLALIIALTLLLGTAGASIAGATFSFIIETFGWRHTMAYLGIFSTILAIFTWFTINDHPNASNLKNKDAHHISVMESMFIILKNRQTWIAGFYGSLMYLPLSGFADLWGTLYAMKVFDVDKYTAALSVSMFYIGLGCGSPLTAYISDYYQSHLKPIIWGAFGTMLLFAVVIYTPNLPFMWSYSLLFIAGMFSACQFIAFATIAEVNPHNISGTATGFHNMLCMISGMLYQPGIGYLLTLSWDGTLENNSPAYSVGDYRFALAIIPIGLFIALITALFIKETYPKVLRINDNLQPSTANS